MPEPEVSRACPLPANGCDEQIVLAHGEGGRLMRRLLEERLLRPLANPVLNALDDSARLPSLSGELALTTDSFVVSPLFFPGGDIGSLAVYGTVNDLLVAGAEPVCLSLSLILEEGLPLATLDRVIASIRAACQRANVFIATGDTKVVPRGAADKLFINTTGLGHFKHSRQPLAPLPSNPAMKSWLPDRSASMASQYSPRAKSLASSRRRKVTALRCTTPLPPYAVRPPPSAPCATPRAAE